MLWQWTPGTMIHAVLHIEFQAVSRFEEYYPLQSRRKIDISESSLSSSLIFSFRTPSSLSISYISVLKFCLDLCFNICMVA